MEDVLDLYTQPEDPDRQGDGIRKLGTGKAATPGIPPEQALTRAVPLTRALAPRCHGAGPHPD